MLNVSLAFAGRRSCPHGRNHSQKGSQGHLSTRCCKAWSTAATAAVDERLARVLMVVSCDRPFLQSVNMIQSLFAALHVD